MKNIRYRLGIDLGTNSIGWAIILLNEAGEVCRVIRLGSRIFPDGRIPNKDRASLAVSRRDARQIRRRRDRYLRRRDLFVSALVAAQLMPADVETAKALVGLNPYELRAAGVTRKLDPHEIGRALFHLNQRRGFKSNRKTDKGGDKESGKIKSAVAAVRTQLSGQTVGQFLWGRLQKGQPVRARLVGEGVRAAYELYVDRAMIAEEFDAICQFQQQFHPDILTPEVSLKLRSILLYQRNLKPVIPGRCALEPEERRAPMALPSSQLFRLYQEVNHLRVIAKAGRDERALTRIERDLVIEQLASSKEKNFDALRKVLFGANRDAFEFSIESLKRSKLLGNDTAAKLAHKTALGGLWNRMNLQAQDAMVQRLLDDPSEDSVITWLQEEFGLSVQAAKVVSSTRLSDDHLRFSSKAVARLLPQLINGWDEERGQPLTYDKAVKAAGYDDHRALDGDGSMGQLPYYGQVLWRYMLDTPTAKNSDEKQFGKIANPTVHLGLNQLRKLVNAIIEKYGKPAQIHVEVARELKANREQKKRLEAEQKENQDRNQELDKKLAELHQRSTPENRLLLKLFYELEPLGRRCIYSGKEIALSRLFGGNEYQIDHILPFSKTLDDGFNNKLLVHRDANRFKGDREPFAAFGHSPSDWPSGWDEIYGRALGLKNRHKAKRFKEGALKEWLNNESDFLARQLNDTAYLARVTREYLSAICPPNRIVCSPGRLTALLRGKWGLNDKNTGIKNRDDHRHHAIDAAVIAVTDRSILNRVSRIAGQAREQNLDRLFADFPLPWEGFRDEVVRNATRCVVSYKPDHGTEGGLHNETAYGIVDGPHENGTYTVRHRVAVSNLKKKDLKSVDCDRHFIGLLEQACAGDNEKEHKEALGRLADQTRHRQVWLVEKMSVVPVRPRDHKGKPFEGAPPYKAYKGDSNYCYEIFRSERGKWDGEVITTFRANQKLYRAFLANQALSRKFSFDGKPLLMRLMRDDMIAIQGENDARRIMRVAKLSEGMIALAEHNEANVDRRNRDTSSEFKYLYKAPSALNSVKARRVFVDILGRVLDPGFKG
jgi:CRISPR-associated endonuclease Csn1